MIDRDDIQDIYRDNLISHMQGIFVVKMTKASFIYRFIADIDLEIKPGESKKLKWGKMEVLVKKSSKDNSLKWYVDGKVVDEETIKLMIGYFNYMPHKFSFVYEAADNGAKLYHFSSGKEFDFCDLIGVYILCTEYNKNYRF